MKEALENLKNQLTGIGYGFNLISSRCKHANPEGAYTKLSQCMHPYWISERSELHACAIKKCPVLNYNREY